MTRRRLSFAARGARCALGALAAAAVATVGACGVATEDRPTLTSRDDVPFDLLAPTGPATTTTTEVESEAVEVFYVRDGKLQAATRSVPLPATVVAGLGALLEGPTEDELDAGMRSALSSSDIIETVEVSRGAAFVELAGAFTQAQPEEQVFGLAQIVFTATGFPGVGAVQFLIDGTPIEVPRPDGSLSGAPVTRDDFRALVS
ncbi:MAG TPA: GerMN domain-containing protein [Acidimicrobiales bacterium]